mgnify:CR=1 FL=1
MVAAVVRVALLGEALVLWRSFKSFRSLREAANMLERIRAPWLVPLHTVSPTAGTIALRVPPLGSLDHVLSALMPNRATFAWNIQSEMVQQLCNAFAALAEMGIDRSLVAGQVWLYSLQPVALKLADTSIVTLPVGTQSQTINPDLPTLLECLHPRVARLFREQLGLSYQQWRQQATLAYALPLLARGQPVSLVAAASGYASESAFTAMFRAAMGQPPSHFSGKTRGSTSLA